MSQDERIETLMAAFRKTTYFKWMARQGIPVVDGYGVEDVCDIYGDNLTGNSEASCSSLCSPIINRSSA